MRVLGKLTAWETQWPFWRELAVYSTVQPAVQTSTVDTAGTQLSRVLSSKSRFQEASVRKFNCFLYWTVLACRPSNARFHFWKRYSRGWAQKHNPELTVYLWGRRNWINPVLPNCTIWYLKISYFISYRNLCSVSQPNWRHKHFSFKEPIIWRQRKRWSEVHQIWCSNYQLSF